MKRRTLLTGLAALPALAVAGALPVMAGVPSKADRYEELKELILSREHRAIWVTHWDYKDIASRIAPDIYAALGDEGTTLVETGSGEPAWVNGVQYNLGSWSDVPKRFIDDDNRIAVVARGIESRPAYTAFVNHLPRWVENLNNPRRADSGVTVFISHFVGTAPGLKHFYF